MTYPRFGCTGSVESETVTFNADQLEFRDGFSTDLFPLKFTNSWKRNKPSYCAQTYGIGKSDDPTRNSLGKPLETVTMTETEEVTTPHMLATQPGISPNLGDKLTYTDGLIFFRKRVEIRISGKGDPPDGFGPEYRGKTYEGNLIIMPAVGDEPVIQEAGGLFIAPIEIPKTVTDWWKFNITLVKFVGNSVANARVNMIVPTLFTMVELQAVSAWFKITRTTTLNFQSQSDVDETVEIYDDVATP